MNKFIFVDTSAFFFFFDDEAPEYKKVLQIFQNTLLTGGKLVTTDYILDELFTIVRCREKLSVSKIIEFVNGVNVSDIEVVGISKELFQEALTIMGKYSDQYFSFTDCTSFALMKKLKIKEAITADRHFATAGFNPLLAA